MYSREALSLGSFIGKPSPTKVDSHRYHNFITKLISCLYILRGSFAVFIDFLKVNEFEAI